MNKRDRIAFQSSNIHLSPRHNCQHQYAERICLERFRVGSKASHRPAFLLKANCLEKETFVAPKLVKANRLGKHGKLIGRKPINRVRTYTVAVVRKSTVPLLERIEAEDSTTRNSIRFNQSLCFAKDTRSAVPLPATTME